MFLTTHASVGLLVSKYVDDPALIFGLAFASHFVLDFIPHGDETLYHDHEWREQRRYRHALIINTLDVFALTGLIIWVIHHPGQVNSQRMLAGILGSILPDFLSFLFPIIHQRLSWLFLVRWLYSLTKPTGLRYLVRGQNWLHQVLHHEIIRRDIPFLAGLAMQLVIITVSLTIIK